jgi:hypothetical protein
MRRTEVDERNKGVEETTQAAPFEKPSVKGAPHNSKGCPTRLLGSGGDFLDVNGLLRRIELAGQNDVRGREVPDGFRIFDNPDGLIFICHKTVGHKDGRPQRQLVGVSIPGDPPKRLPANISARNPRDPAWRVGPHNSRR